MDNIESISTSGAPIIIDQKNSFKLTKNTKGYNWEIRVIGDDFNQIIQETIRIDKIATKEWGTKE
jgi:hypothetical protein